MSRYMDEKFLSLEEYTPGEQPQDKKYIKLNTNESPFPPSPSVLQAINGEEAAKLCLYSDPESKLLKRAIAESYGFESENVFVSNGSDEILNFAFMLYGGVKGTLFPDISYGFYKVFADLYRLDYEQIPLKDDFTIDINDYIGKDKFIVIANPNAPTGITLGVEEIEKIVISNSESVVLIDEAYIDFGGESAMGLVNKYPNLIVCQTYSKSKSMAGARLGFCFAHKDIISDLERIKYSTNPYNINRLTQLAGVKAMENMEYYNEKCAVIAQNREYTREKLTEMGFEVLESKANFLFAKHPDFDGERLYLTLKERGILIRHFNNERICQYNRITIGSVEQMEAFIQAVKTILEENDL